MVKKIVIIVLFVVVVIAIVNDAGRYIITWYNLDETTRATAKLAASANGNRDQAAAVAADFAATQNVTVYAYDENGANVYVWTETPLENTWFLGSVLMGVRGGNLSGQHMLHAESSRPKK